MLEFLYLILFLICLYQVYAYYYFVGKNFIAIKESIANYTQECNELNQHIEELKSSYADLRPFDYGESHLYDDSNYRMKRRTWKEEIKSNRTYNCSLSVCKNASIQPFKYLCKYFNIQINEENLAKFEEVLNNFSAAEQGKILLKNKRDDIVSSLKSSIPKIISIFSAKRLLKELGFSPIDLSDLYLPVYTFQYISAGGNSSSKCEIKLNIQNLDRFISYLSDLIKFKKSVAGQRALMTSQLREKIKQRDNYECKICNISALSEKNLLLEIDHIIPLSKGGVTSEHNLQTLCWRCNRSKGAKILT